MYSKLLGAHVYKTWPQDGFQGWTLEEFVQRAVYVSRDLGVEVDDRLLQRFNELWLHGRDEARKLGWEGDIRGGYPMISLLPEENDAVSLVIVWKQENDGTSFVISERPLPWLEEQTNAWVCTKGCCVR